MAANAWLTRNLHDTCPHLGSGGAELDAIWLYIATDSPANADRFLERLVGSLTKTLSTAPLAGRPRDEFEEGLRSFPVEGYIAFYRVRDGAIEIVHVIHGSRDLGGIFDL